MQLQDWFSESLFTHTFVVFSSNWQCHCFRSLDLYRVHHSSAVKLESLTETVNYKPTLLVTIQHFGPNGFASRLCLHTEQMASVHIPMPTRTSIWWPSVHPLSTLVFHPLWGSEWPVAWRGYEADAHFSWHGLWQRSRWGQPVENLCAPLVFQGD